MISVFACLWGDPKSTEVSLPSGGLSFGFYRKERRSSESLDLPKRTPRWTARPHPEKHISEGPSGRWVHGGCDGVHHQTPIALGLESPGTSSEGSKGHGFHRGGRRNAQQAQH